ncbi:MAG: ThuA domain-containing protein [Chitinophagaceae bacterium]
MKTKMLLWLIAILAVQTIKARQIKLLVMYKTNGFVHKTIPAAKEALTLMATQNGWQMDFTNDSLSFSSYGKLKQYQAIIFMHTTGDILGEEQQSAVEKYMHKGGGFVTIHTGTDTEKDWPWYMRMVGAKFKSHPAQQQVNIVLLDRTHPSTRTLPEVWTRFDELYNFADTLDPKIVVLMELDESSYKGGTMGAHHPIAWYQYFEGGRVFQTALGHTDESFKEEKFLQHIAGGIRWAAGIEQ